MDQILSAVNEAQPDMLITDHLEQRVTNRLSSRA